MSVQSEIFHGDLPQLIEDVDLQEGGLAELDRLNVEILATWAGRIAEATALGYTKGSAWPSFSGVYVDNISWRKTGLLATGTVEGLGLATAGERRKRRLGVAGQEISVGPIEKVVLVFNDQETGEESDGTPLAEVPRRVPKLESDGEIDYKSITTPSGIADRWNIAQAFVTVQDTYFATSEPSMTTAGTAVTPPSAPAVPATIWGSYGEVMRARHPNGWVLDTRDAEEIFPNLWAVTDKYGFYYTALPD